MKVHDSQDMDGCQVTMEHIGVGGIFVLKRIRIVLERKEGLDSLRSDVRVRGVRAGSSSLVPCTSSPTA